MTFQHQLGRRICLLLVPVLLAMPRVALAQFDDPGLAPATPPPPPVTRTPAPPPADMRRPPPVPADAAVSPAVTPRSPVVTTGGETPVKEEVKEETTMLPATLATADEWEARLATSTIAGPIGLLRTQTADVGLPLNFRFATHLQLFQQSSFLVAAPAGMPDSAGDQNSRFLGDLTIGLTGPDITFLRNLEIYLGIYNASNQNKRLDAGRTDPTVILSLADVGVGIKGAWHVATGFGFGLNIGTRFFNSISAVSANYDATNVNFDAIASLDLRKFNPKVPLLFHLNAGYIIDNSIKLLDPAQCPPNMGNNACIRSRVVETFAYGLNNSRLRFALALEIPFRPRVGSSFFGVDLFGEYHVEAATGAGDTLVGDALRTQSTSDIAQCNTNVDKTAAAACAAKVQRFKDGITANITQFVTVGLRLRPVARLVIDLGADIGIQSPGFQMGPPLPRWNVILGAAYTYDAYGAINKLVTRTVTKTYEVTKRIPVGKVAGMVRDAKTKKPIAGAVVRYPGSSLSAQMTGTDGGFVSYDLPPGPVQLQVTATDYEPGQASTTVDADGVRPLEFALKAMPPKEGKVRIRVTDDKVNPLPGATARLVGQGPTGPVTRDAVLDGDMLVGTVPAGNYNVTVDAANFLSKDKQVTVRAGGEETIELSLNKRPKLSHVQITKDAIVIKGTIHFETNKATILPDGLQILNEVIDVLAKNSQIRRVSVEGHTDNSGDQAKNLQLSKDRAAAVVEYMSKQGIAAERLSSVGYGQDKPIVPNLTPQNRATNRRVEFKITEQTAPAGLP